MGRAENQHEQILCLSLDAKHILMATYSRAYCFLGMWLLKSSLYLLCNIVQDVLLGFKIQGNNT